MHSVLGEFAEKVNGTRRMESLLKGWDRCISVTSTDTGVSHHIQVMDRRLTLVPSRMTALESVEVEGKEELLKDVFRGIRNPAKESLDGNLSVFGSDKDQMKLDAIALVLWGF